MNFNKLNTTLLFFLFISQIQAYTGEVVKAIKSPGSFVTGMAFDGEKLWVADRKTDKIYQIDTITGKVLLTIESPAYWPMGLAWDGKYLWNSDIRGRSDIAENLDGMIHQIEPATGNIIKTIKSPSSCPDALAWDGKYLWEADHVARKIICFSPVDGTTIKSFASPSNDPTGMAYDGRYLWISDRIKDEIYMVDPQTGWVIIVADSPGPHPRGLAFHNNCLWIADMQTDTIYVAKTRDDDFIYRKQMQKHSVNFSHELKNFGPGKVINLDVYLALPQNRENQEIFGEIKFTHQPEKIITDKWGQKTAVFHYDTLESGKSAFSEYMVRFKTWNTRYFIYPEKTGSLALIPADIKMRYLADDEKYQINSPVIKNALTEAIGNETNPYWIMRKIHQWLIQKLTYVMDGMWDTAPTVITNGHGSCSEYSFVFISMCRAAGLPTRYVGSTWIKGDETSMDEVFHRWIEVYLPGYGWIPTDPTHGDRDNPRDQAFPVGLVRNAALITTESGGGSQTLGWTYNANEIFITQPKTQINIEYFADWDIPDF